MTIASISKNKNDLPTWDLSEIYKGINDPKIKNDLNEIRKLSKAFKVKWKGKINNLFCV